MVAKKLLQIIWGVFVSIIIGLFVLLYVFRIPVTKPEALLKELGVK